MTDAKVVKLSPRSQATPETRQGESPPSPVEGLNLMKAFLKISDQKRRAEIIEMVERMSPCGANKRGE